MSNRKIIRHRMALPIPDDWDNETWFNQCVTFPDSIKWRSLFWQMIGQFKKGRLWDENTGTVTEAQTIGNEIYYRNLDGGDCGQSPDQIKIEFLNWILDCLGITPVENLPETCEQITDIFKEQCTDCENDDDDCGGDMAIQDIKCEGGKLYKKECCQWVLVCDLSQAIGDTTVTPENEVDSRLCNWAGSFANIMHKILHDFAYEFEVSLCNYDMAWRLQRVRMYFSGIDFDTANLANAITLFCAGTSDIVDDLVNTPVATEADVRCAAYAQISDVTVTSPIADDSVIELLKMFYIGISYQDVTADFVKSLTKAVMNSWLRSNMSVYVDTIYDCTCGGSTPSLSPESSWHGVYNWFLSAGIAGGTQNCTGQQYWPVVQWCVQNSNVHEIGDYGFAFEIVETSATALYLYYNATHEEQCSTEDYVMSLSDPTPLPPGKYILCNATMYANLGDDATPYTLIEKSGYSITPGSPEHGFGQIGKLSMRKETTPGTFWATVTDFRFVLCGDDI